MLDQTDGTAELRARRPLDCEETRTYNMEVAAVSCTGEISARYSTQEKRKPVTQGEISARYTGGNTSQVHKKYQPGIQGNISQVHRRKY